MRKIFVWGLAFLLAAGVIWVVGCGDDKSTTPENEGDLEDPAYDLMNELFSNGVHNLNMYGIEVHSDIFDSIETLGGTKLVPLHLTKAAYDISFSEFSLSLDNNWYVCTFTGTISDDDMSFGVSGTDSVGIIANNVMVTTLDPETVDSVLFRDHVTFTVAADGETAGDISGTIRNHTALKLTIINLNGYQMQLDGAITDTMNLVYTHTAELNCDITITLDGQYDNFRFLWEGEPDPYQGTAELTAEAAISCDQGVTNAPDIAGTWECSWTLGSGKVTSIFEFGDDRWVYTEDLGD